MLGDDRDTTPPVRRIHTRHIYICFLPFFCGCWGPPPLLLCISARMKATKAGISTCPLALSSSSSLFCLSKAPRRISTFLDMYSTHRLCTYVPFFSTPLSSDHYAHERHSERRRRLHPPFSTAVVATAASSIQTAFLCHALIHSP